MANPRIALFVANTTRDLPGIVLTAVELCRRGATCYVIPYAKGRQEVWALAPDFVLLPVLRPYQADQARQFVAAGIQFGLLDTEGVVWSSMEEYKQTLWQDPELTRKANPICLWGPSVADYTVSEKIFDRAQVAITGCPRFDFYTGALASVYKQYLAPVSDVTRPFVLINTNYTVTNLKGTPHDQVVEGMIRTYGYDRDFLAQACENEFAAIPAVIEMANRLAADCSGVDIVLRPHPEEDAATYERRLDRRPNLRLSQAGSVSGWILQASAVIHRSCTTAVEAAMVGIPAFSPQWIPASTYYPIPESVSIPCDSYDELRERVEQAPGGRLRIPSKLQSAVSGTIRDHFFETDGLAHKRVADAVLNGISHAVRPNVGECRKLLYNLKREGFGAKLCGWARYLLGLPPAFSFRDFRAPSAPVEPGWKLESVRSLVNSILTATTKDGPGAIQVKDANTSGDYIAHSYRGRAFVLSPRSQSVQR